MEKETKNTIKYYCDKCGKIIGKGKIVWDYESYDIIMTEGINGYWSDYKGNLCKECREEFIKDKIELDKELTEITKSVIDKMNKKWHTGIYVTFIDRKL